MSTLSYMHPLFNLDQCHASIPTLRWQERSLPCPRCQSQDVDPWGTSHYRPGGNRSWCPGGQRPCNDRTAPLLHRRQRSLPHGMLATLLLCLSCAARRMARELGVQGRTRERGGWWLRKAAVSSDTARRWAGTVAADERSQTAGPTGHAPPGGPQAWGRRPRGRRQQRAPGRGHEDTDRPASSAWVRRQGPVGLQAVQDCTVKTIQKAADRAGHAGRRLCTDSASRYRARKG